MFTIIISYVMILNVIYADYCVMPLQGGRRESFMNNILKGFIACADNRMRIKYLRENAAGSWSVRELNVVGNIIGADLSRCDDIPSKYLKVLDILESRKNIAA